MTLLNNFDTEKTLCAVCGSHDGYVEATGIDYIYDGSSQVCIAWCCGNCGHIYLNPRPMITSISVLYPKNYASFNGKFINSSVISRLKEYIQMRRIKKNLRELPKGARFLDIGCGDGQLLEAIKRCYPTLEVHGLDWKIEADVRRRLEALEIVVHESLLECAELPASFFDLVTMNQLIEHLWEPRECLSKVHHILSPRGCLILATPDIKGYDRQFFKKGLWGGYYFPRHLNLFSRPSLVRLLSDCGFEAVGSRSLVAPVIWCYSLKALAKIHFPSSKWLHRFFDVHNTLLMSIFTAIDWFAILFKISTSNQEVIARKIVNTNDGFSSD